MTIDVDVLTGDPITVTVDSTDPIEVTVENGSAVEISVDVSGGEINTASNLGAGEGVFAQKAASDLEF